MPVLLLYLCLFYFAVCSLLATLVIGVLISQALGLEGVDTDGGPGNGGASLFCRRAPLPARPQFAFIIPLIFYNKYIDADSWDVRFRLMTVQIMSIPLQVDAPWHSCGAIIKQ